MSMNTPPSNVHFISGLPRSGSTLLSAILRQNPRFNAGMSSPIATLFGAVLPKMSAGSEFASFFSDSKRRDVLEGIFSAYYKSQLAANQLVFDTNRMWTSRLPLLRLLFPSSKVLCCVRDVPWVIDSVEKIVRSNPTNVSRVFSPKASRNVYSRVNNLMNLEEGLVGLSWSSLRDAWFGEHADRLIAIQYETLTREPEKTMRRLYAEIGETYFEHDFENVEYEQNEFDEALGLPGLHTVRKKVTYMERPTILPPDLFCKYVESNFWLNEKLNTKGVLVF